MTVSQSIWMGYCYSSYFYFKPVDYARKTRNAIEIGYGGNISPVHCEERCDL